MNALTDDDEDWDAAIARAKLQAAPPKTPTRPPIRVRYPSPSRAPRTLAGYAAPELQVTPPPLPVRQAPPGRGTTPRGPRAAIPQAVAAKLAVVDWGAVKRPGAPWPVAAVRRADEELVTPPPVAKPQLAARPTKRP